MSTILYKKLTATLEQPFTLSCPERLSIAGFYPYLLMYGAPVGTFTFSVIKDAVTLFTKSFTSTDIKAVLETVNDYAHVFYPIIPSDLLHLSSGSYIFRISSSGYSTSETAFIGWCQQHEDIQNEMAYTPSNDTYNSLAVRIKIQERQL